MHPTVLERIAGGDPAAVDECMARYGALVWSLARRHVRQHADAEDAVQDVLIDVWRNAARFDSTIASEATFIATIAHRRLVDRHRKQSRRIATQTMVEEPALGDRSHQADLEEREDAQRVRQFMGRLRAEEKRVLELGLLEGLSQSQISEASGMPLGTVKTHTRRGLKRLREMLAPADSPHPT
ncbi:MAG: RNA polymerase sigma factor [Patescibacteria group bacterium]|nr:RNA polymerase sigma factor [Patescibacteria group bacterium]